MQSVAYQSFDDFSGSSSDSDSDDDDGNVFSQESQEDQLLKRKRPHRLPQIRIPALPTHGSSSNSDNVAVMPPPWKKRRRKRRGKPGFSSALIRKTPPKQPQHQQQRRKRHRKNNNEFVKPLPKIPDLIIPDVTPIAKVHTFVPYLRDLETRYEEAFRRKKSSYESVPQIHEYYMESGRQKFLTHSNGDERLANLRQALNRLDTLGYMRSNHQREFHEVFISACLPQLYGKDLDRCLIRILEENDLDSIQSEVMVVTPRRWGKTMAVSLFLAAYLYTQPEADVCVYSIARRTSTMLVLKVYKMVVALGGGTHVIKRSNQETLKVINMYGSISVCNSYPAASKVLFLYLYLCVCVCCGWLVKKKREVRGKGTIFFFLRFFCFFFAGTQALNTNINQTYYKTERKKKWITRLLWSEKVQENRGTAVDLFKTWMYQSLN